MRLEFIFFNHVQKLMESLKLKFNSGLNAMILHVSHIFWVFATASLFPGALYYKVTSVRHNRDWMFIVLMFLEP